MQVERVMGGMGAAALVAMMAAPAGAATASRAPIVAGEVNGVARPAVVRCDEGHWPLTVDGEPRSFDPGDPAGYRVWHDGSGWHLRTTTPNDGDHVFKGVIRSADDVALVAEYHDEAGDRVHVDGRTIAFEFHTRDHVDGLDFVIGCTDHVSFNLRLEDHTVPASRIWLGYTGRAPGDPFTVFRVG